jgi:hypothetical protein
MDYRGHNWVREFFIRPGVRVVVSSGGEQVTVVSRNRRTRDVIVRPDFDRAGNPNVDETETWWMGNLRIVLALLIALALAAPADAQDAFDLTRATVECSSPKDVGTLPITTTITTLDVATSGVIATFDKRDGPRRWPDVRPPGWDGDIQYTLWIGMQIRGEWHVASPIEFWYTRGLQGDDAGGDITRDMQVARNWTYDCGQMARQPSAGESVAFFVTAGDQRKRDVFAVHERSNVVVVPFPANAPATFTFAAAPQPVVTPPPVATPPPVVVPPPQPGLDLSGVYAQIASMSLKLDDLARASGDAHAAINQNVTDGRAENRSFFSAVKSHWKEVVAVGGPIASWFIAKATGGKCTSSC